MTLAPDPESFSGAGQVFDYLVPAAAVEIVLPAFTFGGPCMQLSHLIYMNQCNPADIMATGAQWLQVGEKYLAARKKLDDHVSGLGAEAWSGEDRTGFDDHADKAGNQLGVIAMFAIEVGLSLMLIGAMLALLVIAMAAFATALLALAVAYWAVQAVPAVGQAASQAIRAAAMTVGAAGFTVVKALDSAVTAAAKALAAIIGGGMGASWVALATQGNRVNPFEVAGPAAFNIAQGSAQWFLRNYAAPAGGKHSAFGPANLFMGGQGLYNLGMNASDNASGDTWAGDPGRWRSDVGLDPGNLDFIPDFERPSWLADSQPPNWRTR